MIRIYQKAAVCLLVGFWGASALANLPADSDRPTVIAHPNAIPDETCARDKQDPYENPARMTMVSELYAGRCINTNRRRVPKIFPDQMTEGLTPVANIHHRGEFWIAYLPFDDDNAIESINVLLLRVKDVVVYAGHGQVEIVFKKPITLRSQNDLTKIDYVNKLYYSVEAAVPVGIDETNGVTNAFISLLSVDSGMYPLVGRVATAEERQVEDADDFWRYDRYPTHLISGEKSSWLKLAMTAADQYGFARHFSMFKDNCVATEVDLFNQLPRIKAMALAPYHAELSTDPGIGPAKKALLARGLIDAQPLKITKETDPDERSKLN